MARGNAATVGSVVVGAGPGEAIRALFCRGAHEVTGASAPALSVVAACRPALEMPVFAKWYDASTSSARWLWFLYWIGVIFLGNVNFFLDCLEFCRRGLAIERGVSRMLIKKLIKRVVA